jgi:hypothetical protein
MLPGSVHGSRSSAAATTMLSSVVVVWLRMMACMQDMHRCTISSTNLFKAAVGCCKDASIHFAALHLGCIGLPVKGCLDLHITVQCKLLIVPVQ